MSSDSDTSLPAISVRGVSKCYDIYDSPVHRLVQMFLPGRDRSRRRFQALRDVSFDVMPGESLGIIGRNGSGKSTLMQIIAGTLAPTTGEVHVRGRVAALLELGSGFNPRFTGRENIYLSGAIMGISAREMDKRFDEIVAFADIGEFLDQPVRVYSSGMHARLAFSVAISVEPDILILDEILSVGDAEFQQKCVGRLRSMLDRGVTLLFVSHAPDAVRSLCEKGLFLVRGEPAFLGPAEQAVDKYLGHVRESTNQRAVATRHRSLEAPVPFADEAPGHLRYGTGHAQIDSVRLLDAQGGSRDGFRFGEEIVVEVAFRAHADVEKLNVAMKVRDRAGVDLFGTTAREEGARVPPLKAGQRATARFTFTNVLHAGPHGVCITIARKPESEGEDRVVLDHLDGAAAFKSIASSDRSVRFKVYVPVTARVLVSKPAEAGEAPAEPVATDSSAVPGGE